MIDQYPDTFAGISIHVGSDGYHTAWGNARATFYGNLADGLPWFAYDGLWDSWPINTYVSKFNNRQAVPTDVTIALSGREVSGPTYDIRANVCIEAGGTRKTMRINMVQVFDRYPVPPDYSRNCFMQAAATEDVTLGPGECQFVDRTFTFDGTSWADPDRIKIIAWAQEPLSSYPAEVHQAKTMTWPFDTMVPTVSEWGLLALALLVLSGGTILIINRKRTAS